MIRELIDTDLEVVAGGRGIGRVPFVPSLPTFSQSLTQTNDITQNATATGGGANTAINAIGAVGNSAVQFGF